MKIGLQMWQCAAEQGHAQAALKLGVNASVNQGNPLDAAAIQTAMRAYQLGAKAGNGVSASFLESAFTITDPSVGFYLGQTQADPERARRYEIIGSFLSKYDYRDPKVPEIDQIVPLPPAQLPPWDGKFQWLEAHKANMPPPLPSEQRIAEMAKAKGLDPKTGRPLNTGK